MNKRYKILHIVFLLVIFSLISSIFSQEIDSVQDTVVQNSEDKKNLVGIWENPYRIVIFDDSLCCDIVLKTFYGWYFDPSIKEKSLKDNSVYPLCINDSLYLDYYEVFEIAQGVFYKPCSNIVDFLINESKESIEVYGYYEVDDKFYQIRYWKIDKDFVDETAIYQDFIQVQKMISIGDSYYTCVPGKGLKIRNVKEVEKPSNIIFSDDNKYMTFAKPYAQKSLIQNIDSEISLHNSKRKPMRKPLIEPMDLDFHYDEIDRIRNKK